MMQSMPAHENHSDGQKHAPSGLCSSMAGRSIEKHVNDCENPSMPTFPPLVGKPSIPHLIGRQGGYESGELNELHAHLG
jgi:hypothetical protein